jgi:predicted ribosome quality control (RQC) complex YloA/Tae2 family protein
VLLDALGLAALVAEMADLRLARVQDVVQPDRLSLALELYRGDRRYLTLSANPAGEGVRLSDTRVRRGAAAATPLTLAVRARVEGAGLADVRQPPDERVLVLVFQADEPISLVAELTGRLANLILVADNGTVLAAARQVTRDMSRARVVLPGQPYSPPPPPAKQPPNAVGAADLGAWLAAAPALPAWRVLVDHVRGLSPLAAREAVFRATGEAEVAAGGAEPERLAAALAGLFGDAAAGRWSPCLAQEAGRAIAYAPYRLTHLPDVTAMPTLTAALAAFEAGRSLGDAYADARAAVGSLLATAQDRATRRVAALAREQASPDDIEALRAAGDLILSFQHRIKPGEPELVAGYDPAQPTRVSLDPALTPAENAARYYDRYRRRKRAAAALPARLAEAEARRATLDQLATDLALANDRGGIDAVHDSLATGGFLEHPPPVRGAPVGAPLAWTSADGFTVLVGRNSRQNERVTFERATRGDPWLHARDVPGAHVVVKAAGRPVPDATLRAAAALAAWFSRDRDAAAVAVAVTDARHVHRLKGGGPGMVTYQHAVTLMVRPTPPDELEQARGDRPGP